MIALIRFRYRPTNRVMRTLLYSISLSQMCIAQQDVQHQRQEIVTALLTGSRPEKASQQRWICFNGDEPSSIKEARAMGFDFTPDASDACVAALQRQARDHRLGEPYKKLLAEAGGDIELSENLPKAIGASALNGRGKVSIGNGKAVVLTSAMAFDAGFTVAYTSAAPNKAADPKKLRSLAESCLAAETDAGTCFSVGHVYGAQAFSAR
jgi:hypothetical protein